MYFAYPKFVHLSRSTLKKNAFLKRNESRTRGDFGLLKETSKCLHPGAELSSGTDGFRISRLTISSAHADAIMIFLGLCYFAVTFYSLYLRYIYFEMKEPTDSAAYMQVAWSIFHWPPYTMSVQENLISYFPFNFLGDQLMWTLALFAPLCLLPFPGIMFLFAQALIICAGAFLLYRFSAEKLDNRLLALLLATCFLFNPATLLSFWDFGFRAETLFIPLTFLIFYLLHRDRPFWACMVLTLFLLTKHNSILVAIPLGFYFIFWDTKYRRFGVFCILASMVYYVVGLKVVMANLQENPVASFKHFAKFGDTPWQAILNIFTHPGDIWQGVSPFTVDYIKRIFLPAGLLAIFSPVFWMASSELLINAVLPAYHSVYCGWHWTLVIPFAFLGMTYTMCWVLKTKWQGYLKCLFVVLLLVQIGLNVRSFTKRVTEDINHFFYKTTHVDTSEIMDKLALIEPEASVMTSGRLLWYFFDRKNVYNSRVKFHDEVDYIAILLPLLNLGENEIDKYILREFSSQLLTGDSSFNGFDLVVKDTNLWIFRNKRIRSE
ncbi:MAG: DUF2079 domain-containing protein [Syntrophobacter sp.]